MSDHGGNPRGTGSLLTRFRHSLQLSPRRLHRLDRLDVAVAGLYFIALVLRRGYHLAVLERIPVELVTGALLIFIVLVRIFLDGAASATPFIFLRRRGVDVGILLLLLFPVHGIRVTGFFFAVRVLATTASRALNSPRGRKLLLDVRQEPARIIALSFFLTIAAGTLFLTFPGSRPEGEPAPLLTALFTATSAVCVTGLIVVDTPTYWSGFGQAVILVLIQVGGLGIMTLSASAALVLGRNLGAGSRSFLSEVVEETSSKDISRLLRFIVGFTLLTELAAALILALRWSDSMSVPQALYFGVFHSVSAFCNAGFSTFSNNLESWVGDPVVNLVIMLLIILGGLGFTVTATLVELGARPHRAGAWWQKTRSHTKLVLLMTGLLVVGGALGYFIFEQGHTLSRLSLSERIWASFFQSVTLRTAGYNTVPLAAAAPATVTLMVVWMFIGGSPGGTAGGIKTTTLGILAFAFRSLARNRPEVEIFNRRLGPETLFKAVAVTLLSGVIVLIGFMGLLLCQPQHHYADILFEVVSAFGTVGVSRGITPALTPLGQLLIIVLMFVGRTGPLTLAMALGRRTAPIHYRYPEARILVG